MVGGHLLRLASQSKYGSPKPHPPALLEHVCSMHLSPHGGCGLGVTSTPQCSKRGNLNCSKTVVIEFIVQVVEAAFIVPRLTHFVVPQKTQRIHVCIYLYVYITKHVHIQTVFAQRELIKEQPHCFFSLSSLLQTSHLLLVRSTLHREASRRYPNQTPESSQPLSTR